MGAQPRPACAAALALLQQHSWPGNVRKLQNIIERAVILAKGEITPTELPAELLTILPAEAPREGIFKHREKAAICTALRHFRGNRRQTAEAPGISLRTLQYRLKELGLLVKEEP